MGRDDVLRETVIEPDSSAAEQASSVELRLSVVSERLLSCVLYLLSAAFSLGIWIKWGDIVHRVYWDADVSAVTVLGKTLDHSTGGSTVIAHFGWFTVMAWELLTRHLPFYRDIWIATPYAFALASAGLLGWASLRLGGRWAAAATVAMCISTSSWTTYNLFTLSFHTYTWFSINLMAASLVFLGDPRLRGRWAASIATSLPVGLVIGANTASDPLLLYNGLLPLACTAVIVLAIQRRRGITLAAALLVIVVTALIVERVVLALTRHWHISIAEQPATRAPLANVWPATQRLARQTLQLTNGDFWNYRASSFGWLLAAACTAFVCAAGLLAVMRGGHRAVRALQSPGTDLSPQVPYVVFWMLVVGFVSAAYVFSTVGFHDGWYFISVVYALAAVVPLVTQDLRLGPLFVTAATTVYCVASLIAVQSQRYPLGSVPAIAADVPRLEKIAAANGVGVGYGDYWDAMPITWQTHFRLPIYPVYECEARKKDDLCPFFINMHTNWYVSRPHQRSLLLVGDTDHFVHKPLSRRLGSPEKIVRMPNATVYIFGYDLAARLKRVPWATVRSTS